MEIDYENLHRVLTRYGQERWSGLKTPIEDVVQETLIKIFEKSDELKDYDRQHLEGHACLTFRYMALNTLLEEHKKGLWIQNSDTLKDERSLYGVLNEAVFFLNDPWLDEFYANKKKRNREYYEKNKEQILMYYQEHKEEISAYSKKYYQEHKDEILQYSHEYSKKYHQKNKERIRAYQREYYRENAENIKQFHKELREKARAIQKEIKEQYGVKITVEKCMKLVTARKKSEETYKERLKQYLSDNRSF